MSERIRSDTDIIQRRPELATEPVLESVLKPATEPILEPLPEQTPEAASQWVEHLPLSAAAVEIDTKQGFLCGENYKLKNILNSHICQGGSVVAGVEAGSSQFIVVDTRQAKHVHSPFLLLQDDVSGGHYKGIWPNEELLIGRGCQAVDRFDGIKDDTFMSLAHFSLFYDEKTDTLTVCDNNSRNKTYVSGTIGPHKKDEIDRRGIRDDFTYNFLDNALPYRLGEGNEVAPYGYYLNHAIIGRKSTTVRDGVYGTAFSEQVVVDDKSNILRGAVKEFLATIDDTSSTIAESRQILSAVEQQVSQVLRYDLKNTEEMCEPYKDAENLIYLSEFVTKGIGVCRHQALLSALYIEAAIDQGCLRDGVVSVERNIDDRQGSGHAWAVYRSNEGEFIVDASQHFVGTREQAIKEKRWRYIVRR